MDILLIGQDPGEVLGRKSRGGGVGADHGLLSLCFPLPLLSWGPQTSESIRITRKVDSEAFPLDRPDLRWELDWKPKWFKKPQALMLKLVGKDPLPGETPLSCQSQRMAPPTSQHRVLRWRNGR